jgi:hypothetical protein
MVFSTGSEKPVGWVVKLFAKIKLTLKRAMDIVTFMFRNFEIISIDTCTKLHSKISEVNP